jgi:capsular exopolysaccharide synthesis family protein
MNFAPASLHRHAPPRTNAVNGLLPQIWRRRRVFVAVFLLTLLPALAVLLLFTPVYYAAGTVVIGNQEPVSASASAAWIEKLGDPADLESQLGIIKSRRMLRLALARPGVTEAVIEECRYRRGIAALLRRGADCSKMTPNSQELVDYAEARYVVRGVGRSRIISIGYESPLPDVAFVMANALIVTYLEDKRAENARAREVTAAWLLKEGAASASRAAGGNGSKGETPGGSALRPREKFYQDLYGKVADIESERRMLQGGARLVSLAELPRFPYFPKRTPLAAAALTVALMLAGLAALRADVTDGSVRRTQELEAMTMIPVLGMLPYTKPGGSGTRPSLRRRISRAVADRLAALLGASSLAMDSTRPEESVQALYARLVQAGAGKTLRSILVCSATQGEGKTFTTLALAKCAAEAGRRVLVIDCNMRRPGLTEKLKLSGAAGLAEILRGEIEPERAVVQSALEGVPVIASGAAGSGMSLLLMESGMQKLMSWAEQFDLVLLDGPAAAGLPDAGILAQSAAGVLWCAQWGRVQRSDVKAALDGIAKPGVKVLGFAVNQVRPEEMRFYERPCLYGSLYEARR